MRKLLVPIDSSDNSLRALQYALDLARERGPIDLHIVNAHEFPVIYGEIAVYAAEEKVKEQQRLHSEKILRPALELAKAAGVSFTSEILVGHVPTVIAQCAEQRGCDAIVMGTRGMSAIGNLFMGSVAMQVVHLTKLPVVLVK